MFKFKLLIKENIKYAAIVLFFMVCGIFGGNTVFSDVLDGNMDYSSAIMLLKENSYILLSLIFLVLTFILGTTFCGVVIINILCVIKGFYIGIYANMFMWICGAGAADFLYIALVAVSTVFFVLIAGMMLSFSLYFFANFKQPFSVTEKMNIVLKRKRIIILFAAIYILAIITENLLVGSL